MPAPPTRRRPPRRRPPARPAVRAPASAHSPGVIGAPAAAGLAATRALAAGRRSRPSVLAHARHQALLAAATPPSYEAAAVEGDTIELGVATDLVALARALAATRAPVERVVVDLDTRHELDRAGLGR